jgi:hypothetical protein
LVVGQPQATEVLDLMKMTVSSTFATTVTWRRLYLYMEIIEVGPARVFFR